VARLNNLTPDNTGRIVFTLSFIGTYHYMAGFKIIEPGGSTSAGRSNGYNPEAPSSALTALASDRGEAVVYPNPFSSQINLNIRELPIGLYLIQVTDAAGKLVLLQRYNKLPGASTNAIQSDFLKPGLYFLQLVGATHKKIYKIIKL
jgi:hypothetical protein